MKDFKQLKVWERSHALAVRVYRVTAKFPADERYALTSQIRRAAYSVPTNIAEACGRNGDAEMARFFDISMGSACELEYLLLLTSDLEYLPKSEYESLTQEVTEVKRMLARFIQTLRGKGKQPAVSGQRPADS